MKVFPLDTSQIYFPCVRKYFEECLNNYLNKQYRSAIVLLYSATICDLMKRLKELDEIYSDTKAQSILSVVSTSRGQPNTVPSQWENDLLNQLKFSDLITTQDYNNIIHLKEDRNLSAHPLLNSEYELVSPTEQTVEKYLFDMYSLFIQQPCFLDNIIDKMSDDIANNKDLFRNNYTELKKYICTKYLPKLNDVMVKKVFKAFWKFCFNSPGKPFCQDNLEILRQTLNVLYEEKQSILYNLFIDEKSYFCSISDTSDDVTINLIFFIARYPNLYTIFDVVTKQRIDSFINNPNNDVYKFISWFKFPNKTDFLSNMTDELNSISLVTSPIAKFFRSQFINDGLENEYLNFCVEFFNHTDGESGFNTSDNHSDLFIQPNLEIFSEHQLKRLIEIINSNSQHYDKDLYPHYRTKMQYQINIKIKKLLTDKNPLFDFTPYPNFYLEKRT